MKDYDLYKILDEEPCPCGSEVNYCNCCKHRKDDNHFDLNNYMKNEGRLSFDIGKMLTDSKIKVCMHPNKNQCSKDIKRAHSLQNNGVLSLLSENGHVISIKPDAGLTGIRLNIGVEGKNQATTFTGFCGYHDTEIFKPIETIEYDPQSEEQNFLFAYRVYALEHYKKIVSFISFKKMIKKLPSRLKGEMFVQYYRNHQLAMDDCEKYSNIMNDGLINNNFSIINTYVIEFDYRIQIAACFGYSPMFDFEGNSLAFEHMAEFNSERLKTNFITILPQENKSYIIYSWLKEDDEYFEKYIEQLKRMNELDVRRNFNNLIPEYTENLIISPKLWERFSKFQKEELQKRIMSEFPRFNNGYMNISNIFGTKLNLDDRAPYNLFRKT